MEVETKVKYDQLRQEEINQRVKDVANHIIATGDTIRKTAKRFKVSKSTVHKDISERLERIDPSLAKKVQRIMEYNKMDSHSRGGVATSLLIKKKAI